MIYDLQFGHKGTTKKRDTQEKKKKNHAARVTSALDAYRAGDVITRRDAGMNGTNAERVPAQR